MKSDSWTFLFVPQGEGGVRTVHVSKRLTKVLGILLLVLLLGVGALLTNYLRQEHVLYQVEQREMEIAGLRSRISEFEEMAADYEAAMQEARRLQERANQIAGLSRPDGGVLNLSGLGGQEPLDLPEDPTNLDRLSQSRLRELHLQLDRLLREARFQRESYQQVVETLREDQILRDCTPSIRPVTGGYLASRYGRRVDPFTGRPAFHRGLDFAARVGTPVYAPAAGVVKRAHRKGSLGLLLEIDHENGVVTRYGHLDEFLVKKGDRVRRGQVIARVGNTGRSTGPHLHYEVVEQGRWKNPWLYIVRD